MIGTIALVIWLVLVAGFLAHAVYRYIVVPYRKEHGG